MSKKKRVTKKNSDCAMTSRRHDTNDEWEKGLVLLILSHSFSIRSLNFICCLVVHFDVRDEKLILNGKKFYATFLNSFVFFCHKNLKNHKKNSRKCSEKKCQISFPWMSLNLPLKKSWISHVFQVNLNLTYDCILSRFLKKEKNTRQKEWEKERKSCRHHSLILFIWKAGDWPQFI